MMGERRIDQAALFYEFSLERHVPADHMLRAIDRFVDLEGVRAYVAPFYSPIGRPSIDPELLIRMLIVGYCFGIRSERRLCEEVHLNLAYRWFCRLGLDGDVPDHSTFSKNRHGRFRDSDLLRHLFETVVERCMSEGLVGGEGFAADASLIKADANRQRGVPGAEGLPAEATSRAIAEYLAVLDDAAFGAATPVVPKFISPNALIWCDGEQRNAWAGASASGDARFKMRRVTHLPRTAYIHDIVFMGQQLIGTVTGHNFVGVFDETGECRPVWRPAFLDDLGDAIFERNLIQLNSMAAGADIEHSYFTAFATGRDHKSWKLNGGPVGQGVVLSGLTREPLVSGLTCPHSARLAGGRLWVCDSGRGTFGYVEDFVHHDHSRARYIEVGRVPGFARGLAVIDDVVLVGLSRVLSDYADYAPGIDPPTSTCGVWMYCAHTGRNLGWIEWPGGDQVYDIQFWGGGEGYVSAL